MATANLSTIQTLVRQLTRTPSQNQLSTSDLNQIINTFVLYDFPQAIRLYNLRSTFTFYTQPNVDVYPTNTTDTTDALYNFSNKIVAIHPGVYCAGVPVMFTQNRDEFFGLYPLYNSIVTRVAIADGTTGPFTGNLLSGPNQNLPGITTQTPVLQNNVTFSTITTSNVAMTVIDYPQPGNNETGLLGFANVPPTSLANFGTVNYLTGAFSVSFVSATVDGANITAETVPYQPGQPIAVLYYDQEFTVRPVPNMAYSIQMQVDILPTELLDSMQTPNLNQWWQYIAYGAARKVFQMKSDLDGVALIDPEFKRQEGLVLSSTATILANERPPTIYTQGNKLGYGFGYGPFSGPF